MSVLSWACASSREIYALGMGCREEEIFDRWINAQKNPCLRATRLSVGFVIAASRLPAERAFFLWGDYDLNIVSGGAALTERMLKEKPDLVRRFLRGTLRALLWFRTNEKEAVGRMAEGFKISPDDALGIMRQRSRATHSMAPFRASSRKKS